MPNGSNNSYRPLGIGLLCSIWLVLVLVGYYYTHKPFDIGLLAGILTTLWRFTVAAGVLSLSGGIGYRILSRHVSFPPLTELALQTALGSGILGLTGFLVGTTIGFRHYFFAVLLLTAAFLFRKHILAWAVQCGHFKAFLSRNGLIFALAGGTGLILLWSLVTALAPPLHFDALTYHLALPQKYLLTGNMNYDSDNMFWGMPQQIEMLYTFPMSLAGPEAATVLGWGLGIITLLGLLGYVKEKLSLLAAWVAVVCLLGGRSLSTSLAWGYTEWPVMLFGMGMIVALDTWRNILKKEYLILAAVFAGFALGSKYTAGQLILIGLAIIFWDGLRGANRRWLSNLLWFGGIAVLVSLPWWIKNWVATSNPFYPLLFPAGAMSQARLDYYSGNVWGSWLDLVILPWQVTVWGVENGVGFSWSIGPLLLGFGALAWVGWQAWGAEKKRLFSTAAIATLTGFIVWALASRLNGLLIQTRLYAAFFPAWAILGALGYESMANLRAAGVRFGRIAAAILLLVFAFNLIETGVDYNQKAPFATLTGTISPASYRTRNLGSYQAAMSALQGLPPNARVLMLWETRSLACLPLCDPDEVIDRWYDDSYKYASAEETLEAWRAQGYTHLLLNTAGREFVQDNDTRISQQSWDRLEILLKSLPAPEAVGSGYQLYKLGTAVENN